MAHCEAKEEWKNRITLAVVMGLIEAIIILFFFSLFL
jgi:hypothetical protein